MVETAANATPGDSTLDRPAALYTIGTTDETPAPTNRKPSNAGNSVGKTIATSRPPAVREPLNRRMRRIPHHVISQSPTNRPEAMVDMKAV